jgi:neural Wiskott-Aldrich syndrome protein
LARADDEGDAPPPPPPKEKLERKIQGGKSMRMFCYADDPREPDLIGECVVDLTEVLTKGETDGMQLLTDDCCLDA